MGNRIEDITIGSHHLIREEYPIDVSTNPPTVIAAGTVTARLFDDDKDSTLRDKDGTGGNAALTLDDARPFEVGDILAAEQGFGNWLIFTEPIDSIDGNVVTVLNHGLPTTVVGRRISVVIGPSITMEPYGTPDLAQKTGWGFSGTILWDHGGMFVGQNIRVETRIVTPGGLVLNQAYRTRVVGGT